MESINYVVDNLNIIKDKINQAKLKCGRNDEIILIGATKSQSPKIIEQIAKNDLLSDVGENRVQELLEKYDYGTNLNWHMIGQLQSNKVKYVIDKVVLIHSLDRLSLAKEIDRQAKNKNLIMDCLVEINIYKEESKGGIAVETINDFMNSLEQFDNINIRGIMTVMPNLDNKNKLIDLYVDLKNIFNQFKHKYQNKYKNIDILSCGMSNDYELAIEYGGSNMIRLGRTIFGERTY